MEISTGKIDRWLIPDPRINLAYDSPLGYINPFPIALSVLSPALFLLSTMPLHSSPEPIIHSEQYYLPGGDLYILIQNTMFRIHRYFFMRDSALFRARMEHSEAYIDDPTQTGTTRSDAIMFFNNFYTTPRTFTTFLSIIYNPRYNLRTVICRPSVCSGGRPHWSCYTPPFRRWSWNLKSGTSTLVGG